MSGKPEKLAEIDTLAAAIRTAMGRASDTFGPSIRRQLGQMVADYLRRSLAGATFIHPGMAKMAKWGQCSERQARENFARLRTYGVVVPVAYASGGRRSTRFWISFEAIARLLMATGANPTPGLLSCIRDAGNPEVRAEARAEVNPAEKPDIQPEPTSAGSYDGGERSQKEGGDVVPMVRRRRNA